MSEHRSKYNVDLSDEGKQDRTYNGILYASQAEMRFAIELDYRLKAGDIASWERQVLYELMANGVHIATYVADFVVTYPDGRREGIEVKGHAGEVWRLKRRMMRALRPDVDLITINAREYRARRRGAV